ncbi:MAG: ATP-binding protein [Lachnobacterium sp.]|nr:ATP-binding protein [Lachnobacterium sp.]MDD6632696.1 ATP-binding protein [Lachnobacterium sp.]
MDTKDILNEIEEIQKRPVEEQIDFYKKALQRDEEKTESRIYLYYNYAVLMYEYGDFRKAMEILEPFLMDYQSYPYRPKMISCFNLMGVATHCEKEYAVSRYYYSVALKIAQDNEDIYYYPYEYNNIAITYIAEKNYDMAYEYLELAEKHISNSASDMGAYVYINKTLLFMKMDLLEDAVETYETSITKYHADSIIPNDAHLCAAMLSYKLGEMDRYEIYKAQILSRLDEMYTAEFIDSCRDLFDCGMDSGDDELINSILSAMDKHIAEHPNEIKVGITGAEFKYNYACKRGDTVAMLEALEQENHYKDLLIRQSEQNHVKSLQESMEINKQLRRAIASKEKAAAAKSQFLANMSHDIRTPINGIMGMLEIIRKTKGNQDKEEECLDKIEVSSKLLLSLVNDVLDMAKLDTDAVVLSHEPFNLDRICNETVEAVSFQAEEAGLEVTGEHDDYTGINILGSPLHLKKILINLFSNSVKYNKPNGKIHMSMKTLERTEDTITCEFKIRDTGVGMSQEFVEKKLFHPFVQADTSSRSNYTGTGLGMSIVKQLIDKMGGTISVESELGEGSCFTVVIPFEIDHEASLKQSEEAENADISGLNIMVAEDNELNMEIIEFLLTEQGAHVEKVQNGQEALDKFEGSEAGTYDVILMDLMMPVMDGISATKAIRASKHAEAETIPIIAMTANAFYEDERKCLDAGMNAHLAKPLDMKMVVSTIAECVGKIAD